MSLIEQFQFNFLDDSRWQFIVSGLKNTIIITFFAVLLGVFLGFLIAIVRSTHDKTGKLKILNVICRVYLTVIRGTPTMVQLLIVYYVIFATVDPGKSDRCHHCVWNELRSICGRDRPFRYHVH